MKQNKSPMSDDKKVLPKNQASRRAPGRFVVSLLIFVFSLGLISQFFIAPQTAKAQFEYTVGLDQWWNTYEEEKSAREAVERTLWDEAMWSIRYSIIRASQMFSRKLAADIATSVASGQEGLESLFRADTYGQLFNKALTSAAGEFIGSFSENFFGDKNVLCNPNPNVQLQITLGLFNANVPEPTCDLESIKDNYAALGQELESGEFLKRVQASFAPTAGDAGKYLEATYYLEREKHTRVSTELGPLEMGYDFTDIMDPLRGTRTTSRETIEKFVDEGLVKQPFSQQGWDQLSSVFSASIAVPFVNQFSNTLVSELLQKWLTGLWGVKDICDIPNRNVGEGSFTDPLLGNRQNFAVGGTGWLVPDFCAELTRPDAAFGGGGYSNPLSYEGVAENQFGDLEMAKIKFGGEYDIISDFVACPTSGAGFINCTIDQDFADAVYNHLTLREAIEQNLVHGDWPFAFTSPVFGEQPGPDSGYSSESIKKLRQARIVPAGWQFAADLIAQQAVSGGPSSYNLNFLINEFYKENSKFYGLVDPDWVLKAPQQKCTAETFGPVSVGGGRRDEWCAASQDCVLESEDGGCLAWGNCTRERNTWWFDGDECPAVYETCQTFSRTIDNFAASYLKNTLNYANCTAQNPGCWWYSTAQNDQGVWQTDSRAYFDRDVALCDAANDGCTELVRTYPGSKANLLKNGSFDQYWTSLSGTTETYHVPGWELAGDVTVANNVSQGIGQMLGLENGDSASQTVDLGGSAGGREFSLSFSVRNCSPDTQISFGPLAGDDVVLLSDLILGEPDLQNTTNSFSVSYTYPSTSSTASALVSFVGDSADGSEPCLIDFVKVEEGEFSSDYTEYGSGPYSYLKIAPDYLDCSASTAANNPACAPYALSCSPQDVGCQNYTSLSSGLVIPGQVRATDYCPSSCNGYATYKQEPTNFSAVEFPRYFIASSGQTCSLNEVGCSAFTNLDTVAAGGEGQENYSFLRRCQKPSVSTDNAPFYTWEGSATTGYQLVLYTLQVNHSSPDRHAPEVVKAFADTNYSCQAIYGLEPGQPGYDERSPDCKQFYNADGLISYRLLADTVLATEDCHPYRLSNSDLTNDQDALDCQASGGFNNVCQSITSSGDCLSAGGRWQNNTCYDLPATASCASGLENYASCLYLGAPAQSTACTAVGCKAYSGNGSGAGFAVVNDSFEINADHWTGGTVVGEAYSVAGSSYSNISTSQNALVRELYFVNTNGDPVSLLNASQSYIISFWAKAQQVPPTATLAVNIDKGQVVNVDNVELSTSWRFYQVALNSALLTDLNNRPLLELTINGGSKFFVDNVIVRNTSDTQYLIENSWTTPAVCDQNHSQAPAPQFMLGCSAYRDVNSQTVYLRSFSRLCEASAVGCEALINTYNSSSAFEQTYNAVCSLEAACSDPDGCPCDADDSAANNFTACTVAYGENSCRFTKLDSQPGQTEIDSLTVLADKFIYVVNDPAKSCLAENKGCTLLARPELDQYDEPVIDRTTANDQLDHTAVYYKKQPDRYDQDLCLNNALSCEEYNGGTNLNPTYFKEPRQKQCEYRIAAGTNTSCWFKVGSDDVCPTFDLIRSFSTIATPNEYQADYNVVPYRCTALPAGDQLAVEFQNYANDQEIVDAWYSKKWSQACPGQYSSCSLFLDPAATDHFENSDNQYYYLDNNQLDDDSCNGQGSLRQGCVLFRDYNQTNWAEAEESMTWEPDNVNWYAQGTYDKSSANGNSKVSPIDCTNPTSVAESNLCNSSPQPVNDSNRILAVRRDRICAEWLDCQTSMDVYNPQLGRYTSICLQLMPCKELRSEDETATTLQCTKVDVITDETGSTFADPQPLTLALYQSRSLDWDGYDFSGYSVPFLYPLWSLEEKAFGVCSNDPTEECIDSQNCGGSNECLLGFCSNDHNKRCNADSLCGTNNQCVKTQYDYRLTNVDRSEYGNDQARGLGTRRSYGQAESGNPIFADLPIDPREKSCRGYPEVNSPFSKALADDPRSESLFSGANFCALNSVGRASFLGASTTSNACDCTYEKFQFDAGTAYYPANTDKKTKICTDSDSESNSAYVAKGQICESDIDCMDETNEPNYLPDIVLADGGSVEPYSQGNFTGNTPSKNDICRPAKEVITNYGWRGYCLEKADSYVIDNNLTGDKLCTTWLPIDLVLGEPDIYNDVPDAGLQVDNYSPPFWYCLAADGNYDRYGVENYKITTRTDEDPPEGGGGDTSFAEPRDDADLPWTANILSPYASSDPANCECSYKVGGKYCSISGRDCSTTNCAPVEGLCQTHTAECSDPFGGAPGCEAGWQWSSGIRKIPALATEDTINKDDLRFIEFVPQPDVSGAGDWLQVPFRVGPENTWTFAWCGRHDQTDDLTNAESRSCDGGINLSNKDFAWLANEFFRANGSNCKQDEAGGNNIFAIEADFDSDGVFNGFKSGLCDAGDATTVGGEDSGGFMVFSEVRFILKETCYAAVKVSNNGRGGDESNIFDTQDGWAAVNTDLVHEGVGPYSFGGSSGATVNFDLENPPFGKATPDDLDDEDFNFNLLNYKFEVHNISDRYDRPFYLNDQPSFASTFACIGNCGKNEFGGGGLCVRDSLYPADGGESFDDGLACNPASSSCDSEGNDEYCLGSASATLPALTADNAKDFGSDNLHRLYKKAFAYLQWNEAQSQYDRILSFANNDYLDTRRQDGLTPRVTPAKRSADGSFSEIPTGGQGLSVNFVHDEVWVAPTRFAAFVSFFAYNPNGSQMPLRKIFIDFEGDGTASQDFGNGPVLTSFPNYKPNCDDDDFGSTAPACLASPVSLKHTYNFQGSSGPSAGIIGYHSNCSTTNLDGTQDITGPCNVYRPQVRIVDNWGLCSTKTISDLIPSSKKLWDEDNDCAGVWVPYGGYIVVYESN